MRRRFHSTPTPIRGDPFSLQCERMNSGGDSLETVLRVRSEIYSLTCANKSSTSFQRKDKQLRFTHQIADIGAEL